MKKRFLRNKINGGDSEDGSNYGLSQVSGSMVSGDRQTISKVGSKYSKKAFSKTDRQSFLNRGRSAYKSTSKNGDMVSEVKSRRNKGSALIGSGNNGTRSNQLLTKGPDLGNPRYRADKAPSEAGLLIGTINDKKGTLNAFNSRNGHSFVEVLDDENDPYIREQDNYFEEGDEGSELNKRALRTLNALNKGSDEGSEHGNIDEITFQEFDEETIDRRTFYDEDGEIMEAGAH